MIGKITFILLILAMITGLIKRKKLHEHLGVLTIFSLMLHVLQNPTFTFQCYLILIISIFIFLTGFKIFKIKTRVKLHIFFSIILLILIAFHISLFILPSKTSIVGRVIKLPEPSLKGEMSVEEALLKRRSIRDYKDEYLSLKQLSQILWAAQGITSEWGGRTAPSAGATYPLEVYVLVRKVEGLEKGIYHYNPKDHSLILIKDGDYSSELMYAALNQEWIKRGSINLIITAEFFRTTSKYGERGERYVYLEAGHAAQNVYLQATALNLGSVVVGAFNDEEVQRVLSIPENHKPIYLIPVGKI